MLRKVHVQFGHIGTVKLLGILQDASVAKKGDRRFLDDIRKKCEGCLVRRKADRTPKVAPPSANNFN